MFSVTQFLEDQFGTPDAIISLSANIGIDAPDRDTVRKWFSRGRIPGEWWPVLLVSLEVDQGMPVSLRDYLCEEKMYHDVFG